MVAEWVGTADYAKFLSKNAGRLSGDELDAAWLDSDEYQDYCARSDERAIQLMLENKLGSMGDGNYTIEQIKPVAEKMKAAGIPIKNRLFANLAE